MIVREWLEQHPEAIVEEIGEGYGDGWMSVKDALDEEIREVWYDEKTKIAEIYIQGVDKTPTPWYNKYIKKNKKERE